MSKNILITGAAGFLGSHLSDRFIKEGFNVIGMDNFFTGDSKYIKHFKSLSQEELHKSEHKDFTKHLKK